METNFESLTKEQNEQIDKARKAGYCDYYPCFNGEEKQAQNTYNGAMKYLESLPKN